MAGRPRQHQSNADRQRAYRQRAKQPSVTKLVQDIQDVRKAIADHGPYQPNAAWIDRSARLFDDFMRARRALLAVDPHHPAGFRQW